MVVVAIIAKRQKTKEYIVAFISYDLDVKGSDLSMFKFCAVCRCGFFLVADTQLYKRLCPFVGPSVGP